MSQQNSENGIILVISATESFLAKSLISKISISGFYTMFSHGDIKDIDNVRDKVELIIFFLSDEMEDMTETFVYLKDMASERDLKIIMILI